MRGEMLFKVPAFSTPFSDTWLTSSLRLTEFQDKVYRVVTSGRSILLTAPTGSGKTLTLLLNTEHGVRNLRGFVALYPNNTLLKNQLCTVEDIIIEHFNAKMIYSSNLTGKDTTGYIRRPECLNVGSEENVEPLTIYRVDKDIIKEPFRSHYEYVGLMALSGRYIVSSDGIPKGEILYQLAEKILEYSRKGSMYLIVFATPDTYLLVSTGSYRDFEYVGKTVHNILLALASGKSPESLERILRETRVLVRSSNADVITAAERLLKLPLFIDEFHLYGIYELDALAALLKLYRETAGLPVVFSSATPAEDSLKWLGVGQLDEVKATVNESRDGFTVRGDTLFRIVSVDTGRRGMPAYYDVVKAVPSFVKEDLVKRLNKVENGRALVIVDRLWMVSELARYLSSLGLPVDCIASIAPDNLCKPGVDVIVASESATQGVNLGKVVLGVTAGTSAEDVVQRIGRVGRRGVDSEMYLLVPRYVVEENPPQDVMNYYEMVEWIGRVYPNYPKRARDLSKLLPRELHEVRRNIIYSVGIASLARVSGKIHLLNKVSITKDEAEKALNAVIGSPETLVKLLVLRKTGYNVTYVVEETGKLGENSLGLIARNFEIKDVDRSGRLTIKLVPSRQNLKIRVKREPRALMGKLIELRELLRLLGGRIEVSGKVSIEATQVKDCLAFVIDAGSDIAEYLSYSGEGAEIVYPGGSRYATIFI